LIPMLGDDAKYMRLALRLAARGLGRTSPNPVVGAVVVQGGTVVGTGYHEVAGGPHAESNALATAGDLGRGGTLYVTLEPCNHHGRTPPCTETILRSGVRRVVVGCLDPNPHVSGGGVEVLLGRGLEVEVGVEEERCRRLNDAFIKHVTTGLPLVMAKAAASLDGKIATRMGDSRWITNERSRRFVHRLRLVADAILVGVGTVVADDPRLTARVPTKAKRKPIRVIVDTRLRTPLESQVVTSTGEVPTVIATGPEPDRGRLAALEGRGAEVLPLPLEDGRVSLSALLKALGARQITSVLVEGGAEINGSFFRAGLVDKVYFFFAPKIMGGRNAVPIVGGAGVASVAESAALSRLRLHRFGGDIMIEAYLASSFVAPAKAG
jgi:diaminohydroxyphosphoribosylaminopyrimidine deaminase/5-amino-6-(5-phosphoribosylamino)uracil reductase